MTRSLFFVTIIFSIALFVGCEHSSKPSDLPVLYPCTLTFTQEGIPLVGAIIELAAQDANDTKYVPVQHTADDGTAKMSTYGFAGVPAGKYKIIVTKIVEDEIAVQDKDTGETIFVGSERHRTIDAIYSDVKTTPLEVEVTGKEKNTKQTFDVGKAVKVKL
ncbi:MAG: hypothetical protein LBK06_05445 [Planctomycetaceae bacterium]|jgi:hypothetical protein|nr:hypothetical protein [Planctomycetaceae bacterium]